MPELVGCLQCVLVDLIVGRGERLPSPVLDPLYPSNLGHSPAYADQGHLRPWENASLPHAALSLVPVQPRLEGWRDRGEPLYTGLVDGSGDAELPVIGKN